MTPGCGDFQRTTGGFHAFHISQIGAPRSFGYAGRLRRSKHLGAAEVVDEGEQIRGGQDLDIAGPGGFSTLSGRADQTEIPRSCADGSWQHTGYRMQGTVEMQLPKRGITPEFVAGQNVHGCEHAERQWEVKVAAFLKQIGGREIDEDPPRGE